MRKLITNRTLSWLAGLLFLAYMILSALSNWQGWKMPKNAEICRDLAWISMISGGSFIVWKWSRTSRKYFRLALIYGTISFFVLGAAIEVEDLLWDFGYIIDLHIEDFVIWLFVAGMVVATFYILRAYWYLLVLRQRYRAINKQKRS